MPAILTNKLGLPDTIVKACSYDSHKVAGDLSVTQLIDSPRVRILKRKHDYEEDVSDMLFALMGTALHHILERANIDQVRQRAFMLTVDTIQNKAKLIEKDDPNKAQQLRNCAKYVFDLIPIFFKEIAHRYLFEYTIRIDVNGRVLYGTFDLYDKIDKILFDYKYCSTWQYTFPESQKKWKVQTNIYAYGLTIEGYEVKKIRIIAFFRDWHSSAVIQSRDYPKQQILEIPVEVVEPAKVQLYIEKRVKLHTDAETTDVIPDCTGAERWAKADSWAVKSKGVKKAIRLFDEESMADAFIAENITRFKGIHKQFRPGESNRCDKYCPVAIHCDQRQRELAYRKQIIDKE